LSADIVLKRKFNEIGKDGTYREASGPGKNTNYRISKLLELGGKYFKK
jgi:hypothetical protein